jgi:hypothetical protein
VREVSI